MLRTLILLPLAALGCLLPPRLAAQSLPASLTFSTIFDALEVSISERVLTEAYRRLGVTVVVERFPGEAALRKSDAGEVDGELYRIDHIEADAPNLVQVPVPIAYLEVGVFTHDPTYRVQSWVDLRARRVGVVRGVLAVERSIGDLRTLQVDTYDELYAALARGDVDAIVVASQHLAAVPVLARDRRGLHLAGLLDTYLAYHYLHRRNAAIVAELEPILKSMLMDGSIARVRADVMAAVMQGRRP